MIRVRWIGRKKFERDMKRAARRLPSEMHRRLAMAGEAIVGEAQAHGFQGERTRALYRISGGRRVARKPPRAVTSPPNKLGVFSGAYRRAMSYEITGRKRHLNAEVGPVQIRYAPAHEFGLGNMPQRQVLTPAIKAKEKLVFALLGKTFNVLR